MRTLLLSIAFASSALTACGGSESSGSSQDATTDTAASDDSGLGGDVSDVDTNPIFRDVIGPDVPDTGTFTLVDGGTGCPMPDHAGGDHTCCNGAFCNGACVLFAGESTPVCYCAGLRGGCPDGVGCCWAKEQCTNSCPGGL